MRDKKQLQVIDLADLDNVYGGVGLDDRLLTPPKVSPGQGCLWDVAKGAGFGALTGASGGVWGALGGGAIGAAKGAITSPDCWQVAKDYWNDHNGPANSTYTPAQYDPSTGQLTPGKLEGPSESSGYTPDPSDFGDAEHSDYGSVSADQGGSGYTADPADFGDADHSDYGSYGADQGGGGGEYSGNDFGDSSVGSGDTAEA